MVFEDEWKKKPELIKAMIKFRLKKFDGIRLHARKLEARRLQHNKEWEPFFNQYHLDGSAKARFGYGLFHDGEMVECMTVRTNHRGECEIARLATDYHYSVMGGASKLIAAIKKEIGDKPLVSFSNNRLSSGGIYKTLGFENITQTTAPSYYYTDGNVRIWRYRCKRINEPEIIKDFPTETAQAHGGIFAERILGEKKPLWRIEDCGHIKWVLK